MGEHFGKPGRDHRSKVVFSSRYVKFDTPYHHIGFNNQLQDMCVRRYRRLCFGTDQIMRFLLSLLSAQMAYMSNRAYAFQPYLWDINTWHRTVIDVDGVTERSAIIPINAFLGGPAAGGPMPASSEPSLLL